MDQHFTTIILIIALILFSIYRRVRRNIGWQQLKQGNLVFRTLLFLIIGLGFLAGGVFHPISLISDIIGILIGVILAYYGSMITKYEHRDGRLHYRPNIWIGSIVTFIFLARFFYRFYAIYKMGAIGGVQQQTNDFQNMSASLGNSWTAGLILIMFAYYVVYYTILLRKQKQMQPADKK